MKVERRDVFTTAAWIGGALLLAGLVRFWIQNDLTTPNKSMLIGGGVLLLAALVGNFPLIAGFFRSRGAKLATNTAVLLLAFLGILGLLNFLGYRHAKRWDWTAEKLFTLSDETKKVVGGLKQDVRIIHFDKDVGRDPLAESMAEYHRISPRVIYQVVDPDERPDIARQYEVRQQGDLVVSSGLRTEHLKEADEPAITSAILKVTQARQKSVCFVAGHGERSLSDNDGQGFSSVQKELERENYTVKPVNLVEAQQVPAECDVVVVAGPKTGYFPEETEWLKKYLDSGGKLLVLVDPGTDPKLESLLKSWNISLENDLALGVSRAELLSGLGAAAPIVIHYGSHPITETLTNRMTFFPMARTVNAADKKNYQNPVTELLLTSERSFAKENWDAKQKELKFEQGKDRAGPLTLGVAEAAGVGGKSGRLVVIGNSSFAANAFLPQASNADLFDNSVNWLAQDENLISIRPKMHTDRRVLFTQVQEDLFRTFSRFLVPGAVFVTGLILWWKRR